MRAASGSCSVGIVLFGGTLATLVAQSPPKFDVDIIRLNKSDETRVSGGFQPGGVYRVTNYTLRSLIAAAYLRPQINPDFLISGGPKWIDSDRFDVEAKAAGEFPVISGPESLSSPRRVMLQALLAERFQLKVHLESFERPIYVLKVANSNRKQVSGLTGAAVDCTAPRPGRPCSPRIGPGMIDLPGTTMTQFAGLLPRFVDRMVRDQTGLTGSLDLKLNWTPAPGEWVAPPTAEVALAPPADGPSIFTAIQEQMGLKLEPSRGPVEFLVIDNAERPSQN
jgi:uncharacterized protein (TIGR03435 family)